MYQPTMEKKKEERGLDIDGLRLVELFDEFLSYVGNLDAEQAIEILNKIGMTKNEAKALHFYSEVYTELKDKPWYEEEEEAS